MPRTHLPPPSPAYRMGQHDFLARRPYDPYAFRHFDLQREFRAGWDAERKDTVS